MINSTLTFPRLRGPHLCVSNQKQTCPLAGRLRMLTCFVNLNFFEVNKFTNVLIMCFTVFFSGFWIQFVYLSSLACHNKIPQRSSLNSRTLFGHMSGGWKSGIKESSGLVSDDGAFPGFFVSSHGLLLRDLCCLFLQWHKSYPIRDPPSFNLVTSLEILSPNIVALSFTMNFGGDIILSITACSGMQIERWKPRSERRILYSTPL